MLKRNLLIFKKKIKINFLKIKYKYGLKLNFFILLLYNKIK